MRGALPPPIEKRFKFAPAFIPTPLYIVYVAMSAWYIQGPMSNNSCELSADSWLFMCSLFSTVLQYYLGVQPLKIYDYYYWKRCNGRWKFEYLSELWDCWFALNVNCMVLVSFGRQIRDFVNIYYIELYIAIGMTTRGSILKPIP